jgi:starch synthase (maltosyl-transferring)
VNRFRRENPALQLFTNLRFCPASDDNIIFYAKMTPDRSNAVFVAVNLDPFETHEAVLEFPLEEMGLGPDGEFELAELFTGERQRQSGGQLNIRLDPHDNPAAIWRAIL